MSKEPSSDRVGQLDEAIHQRHRLGIMAFLSGVDRADFTTIRNELGLTDGNLNRHLALLADVGYVRISKPATPGRRARTWVALSSAGRQALSTHLQALQTLIDSVPPA